MNGPEGAMHSAIHDPDAEGPQVRVSRTRARSTPRDAPATGSPRPGAVRSAIEIARERWGTPIGSVTTSRGRDRAADDDAGDVRSEVRRDPMAVLRIWTEPSPPMSAILTDLRTGSRMQAEYGWAWLIPYWLFGIPAFAVACAARLLLDSSARPGRFAALLVALLLFAAGLYLADVI